MTLESSSNSKVYDFKKPVQNITLTYGIIISEDAEVCISMDPTLVLALDTSPFPGSNFVSRKLL